MKILAIIPAFNSAALIGNVLDKTARFIPDILVVDDGSTEKTAEVARSRGIPVICHDTNRGKGAALKTGFAYAIANNYDLVLTIDSDGQHDPSYIPSFIDTYDATAADLIIGSRRNDLADMPLPRRCSNFLTSTVLSVLLKTRIEDSQSGYRLLSVPMLQSLKLKSDQYQLESELIIKAVQNGFKIAFVPIKVVYGKKFASSIKGLRDTCLWLKMVLEEI